MPHFPHAAAGDLQGRADVVAEPHRPERLVRDLWRARTGHRQVKTGFRYSTVVTRARDVDKRKLVLTRLSPRAGGRGRRPALNHRHEW